MKICIIEGIADETFGGAEKSMSNFCEYARSQNNELFLACEKLGTYGGYKNDAVIEINLSSPRAQGIVSYIKSIFKLCSFILKNKVEVILTHTIHCFPLIRIVTYLTGIRSIIYFKWVYTGPIIGKFNSWGLNGLSKMIAINPFVSNYWLNQLHKKKGMVCIPDGTTFEVIENSTSYRNKIKKLLFFGRIYEGKGLHLIIESISKIKGLNLTVLGDFQEPNSEYENYISNLICENGLENRVKMRGRVKNVSSYIQDSDLVVVPSVIDDAQPLAILEAIAQNCPVIAANIGGIPDIFSGNEFWMFEPNTKSIISKLNEIVLMNVSERNFKLQKLRKKVALKYNILNTQQILLNSIYKK